MRFGKVDARYLGGVTLLASILLVTFSAVTGRGTDWWAAWGQWVGGIGSIAAAAAALWIAVEGWRRADAETQRQQEQTHQTQRKMYASSFAAWLLDDGDGSRSAFYHNGSALPVFEAVVVVDLTYITTTTNIERSSKIVASSDTLSPTSEPQHWRALSDRIDRFLGVATVHPVFKAPLRMEDEPALLHRVTVTTAFTDVNETRWVRWPSGRLEEIDSSIKNPAWTGGPRT
jgi:hypothetical protein